MQDIFSNLGYREAGKLVHNAIVQIYTQYISYVNSNSAFLRSLIKLIRNYFCTGLQYV